MYLTSPLGAGIQKYHGASQFPISDLCSFLVSVRLVGGRTHHEGLAIDHTICIHFVSNLCPAKIFLAKPRT